MIVLKKTELALLLTVAACLSACGGGGGGSPDLKPSSGTPPVPVVDPNPEPGPNANAGSSGTFVVTEPGLPGRLISVATGKSVSLPSSPRTINSLPEDDQWVPSADGGTLLRWNESGFSTNPNTRIWMFDAKTMAQTGFVELEGQSGRPLLSFDGKYILGSVMNADNRRILTVFDAKTGHVVKRGSLIDRDRQDTIIGGSRFAWLDNGLYVYMVANKLAGGNPGTPSNKDAYIATLDLPFNSLTSAVDYAMGQPGLAVSPEGSRVALSWAEKRNGTFDSLIWILEMDKAGGVKSLGRVTSVPSPGTPLRFPYAEPSWSPDGKYISFVLHMEGTTSSLMFPDEEFAGEVITGTTGCGGSVAYVLPATARNTVLSWPTIDTAHAIKVKAPSGQGWKWLTTCGSLFWTQ